jgi:hypothetical protein
VFERRQAAGVPREDFSRSDGRKLGHAAQPAQLFRR